MKKKCNNYAFIDSQNLNLGIRELGWKDEIKLPEGIRSVIDWVEANWDTLKDAPMEYEFKP